MEKREKISFSKAEKGLIFIIGFALSLIAVGLVFAGNKDVESIVLGVFAKTFPIMLIGAFYFLYVVYREDKEKSTENKA